MDENVKNFIEDNIDDIQNNDWDLFFISLINNFRNYMSIQGFTKKALEALTEAGVDYCITFAPKYDVSKQSLDTLLQKLAYIHYPDSEFTIQDYFISTDDFTNNSEENIKKLINVAKDLNFNAYKSLKHNSKGPTYLLLPMGMSLRSYIQDMQYVTGEGSIKDFKQV